MSLRAITRNFGWLAGAQIVLRLSYLLMIAVVGRCLSLEQFAFVTFALLFSTMWHPVYDFAMSSVAIRDLAQGALSVDAMRRGLIGVKAVAAIAGLATICAGMMMLGYGAEGLVPVVGIAAAPVVLNVGEFLHAPFTARDEMHVTARLTAFARLAAVGTALVGVWLACTPRAFGIGYLSGAMVGLGVVMWAFVRRWGPVSLGISPPLARRFLREATPMAAQLLIVALYGRLGVLLVEHVGSDAEVAFFNTAFYVMLTLQLAISTLMQSAYPTLARMSAGDPDRLTAGVRRLVGWGVPALVVLGAVGVWASQPMMTLAFGSALAGAGAFMGPLVAAVPAYFVNTLLVYYMRAARLQRLLPVFSGCGLVLVVLAGGVAVGIGGPREVAAAMALAEGALTLVGLMVLALWRRPATYGITLPLALLVGLATATLLAASRWTGHLGEIVGALVLWGILWLGVIRWERRRAVLPPGTSEGAGR
ncbi:MAG TPA: oligosaccharide flippase family protein [Gemmatimonadaceae bacterium]